MTERRTMLRSPVAAESVTREPGVEPVADYGVEAVEPPEPSVAPTRSLLATAVSETFRKRGAQIGAVWIAFLLLIAVFAPFIANSRPYLLRRNGSFESPLLRGLTDMDVLLLTLFGVVATLLIIHRFFRRLTFGIGLGAVVSVGIGCGLALWWTEAWELLNHEMLFDGALPKDPKEHAFAAAGVGLAIAFVLVLPWLTMRVWSWKVRLGAAAALLAVLLPFVVWFSFNPTNPPKLARLQQWRQAQERDQIDYVIRAPIPFSPNDRLRDLGDARKLAPWWLPNEEAKQLPTSHWLGTTINGEDMASRMMFAARVALAIGIIATGISTVIGIFLGALMGYFGGIVDLLMMRFVEIVQALPVLVVLMIVTQFFGKDIWLMMVAIGLMSWTSNARFVRAEFLRLRGQDFVQAGRSLGLPLRSILFRHMLPNGVAPVLVNASFGIAAAILFESVLSFLGLGLEAKDPSWGQLLDQARESGTGFSWWIAIFPGLAIFLTVFSYILIGESVRDAIDPKLKKD